MSIEVGIQPTVRWISVLSFWSGRWPAALTWMILDCFLICGLDDLGREIHERFTADFTSFLSEHPFLVEEKKNVVTGVTVWQLVSRSFVLQEKVRRQPVRFTSNDTSCNSFFSLEKSTTASSSFHVLSSGHLNDCQHVGKQKEMSELFSPLWWMLWKLVTLHTKEID